MSSFSDVNLYIYTVM